MFRQLKDRLGRDRGMKRAGRGAPPQIEALEGREMKTAGLHLTPALYLPGPGKAADVFVAGKATILPVEDHADGTSTDLGFHRQPDAAATPPGSVLVATASDPSQATGDGGSAAGVSRKI